jgi:hypothetical protein
MVGDRTRGSSKSSKTGRQQLLAALRQQAGRGREDLVVASADSKDSQTKSPQVLKLTSDDHCSVLYLFSLFLAMCGGWSVWIGCGIEDPSWGAPQITGKALMGIFLVISVCVMILTVIPAKLARAELIESKVRLIPLFSVANQTMEIKT